MPLAQDVLERITFSKKNGSDQLYLVPPVQSRHKMAAAAQDPGSTQVADVIKKTVPEIDVPVRMYIPFGDGPFPVICYYHGGGFVLGGLEMADELCRRLCNYSGCIIAAIGYRLAPEQPYPRGPESSADAATWVYRHAHEFNGMRSHMAVAGESAGGYMALYTARVLREKQIELKAQFAAYPATDHYNSRHKSWEENGKDYILTATVAKWFWDNFVGDPAKFEEASLLRSSDFTGLPPAMIFTAHYDIMRDEGKVYADKLAAAGVPVVYKDYENIHSFLGLGEMGEEALITASHFLKEKLFHSE